MQHEGTIAILDDDPAVRKSLSRLFRIANYETRTFASAADFLGSIAQSLPRCVLLDLQLGDMSGIEVLQQLQNLQDHLPVVVITSNDEQRIHDQCMALGAEHYFRKPLDGRALVALVDSIVGH